MLPAFICFFAASYALPMITQLIMDYPSCTFNEVIELRTHDDIEKVLHMKPADVIRKQLNGKQNSRRTNFNLLESLLPSDDNNTTVGSLTRQHSESMSTMTSYSRHHSRANSSVWDSLRQEWPFTSAYYNLFATLRNDSFSVFWGGPFYAALKLYLKAAVTWWQWC